MQWLTADIVFDGYDFHSNFFIQKSTDGKILAIQRGEKPIGDIRKLKGLLMPGMINAHCHLELSHTKGLINEKTGLPTFLQHVSKQLPKNYDEESIQKAMQLADKQMQENGIVAVGDICNTALSVAVKQHSKIYYYNFVECIAIKTADSQKRFADYKKVYDKFKNASATTSFALHAPYTCNEKLYQLVNEHSNFISIHNQESEAENLLFQRQVGGFDDFYNYFGVDKTEIIKEQTNQSSFENSQRLLNKQTKKLFVHNTNTRTNDLKLANDNTWFCFCPKANLYIENTLPNVPIFKNVQEKIVLGTDSLASNDTLNILAEVKTMQDNFPEIPLHKILQWSTINGARLLVLENDLGSFEVGKKPGFVSVTDFNSNEKRLNSINALLI